jgi:enamine deaminase RidA (YjgF/YER057c/UK114 family)
MTMTTDTHHDHKHDHGHDDHGHAHHGSGIKRLHEGKRLSEAVIYHGFVYLAGQVANDPTADAKGQTEQVLKQIDDLLEESGSAKTRILSATIYLPNMADFAAMNVAWEAWVPQGNKPARATVQASLAAQEYKVEIQVVACTY